MGGAWGAIVLLQEDLEPHCVLGISFPFSLQLAYLSLS